VPSLEKVWRAIPVRAAGPVDVSTYANGTLHADVPFASRIRELMRPDPLGNRSLVRARVRGVIDYSAKLGRRRDLDDDVDLFTVLPTSRSCSSPTVRMGLAADVDRARGSRRLRMRESSSAR
jgi:hypothetical protein